MSNNDTKYKLTLDGEGIAVTKNVDEETARRILNLLLGGGTSSFRFLGDRAPQRSGSADEKETPAQGTARDGVKSKQPNISLREYLDDVQAKRNPDKILAIASYLVDMAGAEDFGSDDIKGYFSQAAEKMPANYARDFRWVVSSGWIAKHHGAPDRYYVTATGRKALSEKFPKELAKPQPSYLKRKKKASKQ